MSGSAELPDFDAELGFADLLKPERAERLRAALSEACGAELRWRMPGEAATGAPEAALRFELETLAFLSGALEPPRLAAAAALVEAQFFAEARYLRASAMHHEVVQRDFEELQAEHEALKASETRYRELAGELEQRVAAQVEVIELTQRRLYETEKLSAVGQLAAGIAHEINNPIGFIASNLRAAQDYLQDIAAFVDEVLPACPPALAAWRDRGLAANLVDFFALVQEASDGAKRVARIVSDLKDFSHLDRSQSVEVDINQTILSMLNVAQHELGGRTELALAEDLPLVGCDGARLSQAFYAIAQNAAQAMPEGGLLRIESGLEQGLVVVRFRDSGAGIAPEHLPRIFEPFFTTKPVGSGTGLGLTVARDSVRALGGDIAVDSRLGEGTVMSVRLPPARGPRP